MTSIVQTIQHGNLLREGDWRDQSVMDIQKLLKGAITGPVYAGGVRIGPVCVRIFAAIRVWIAAIRTES